MISAVAEQMLAPLTDADEPVRWVFSCTCRASGPMMHRAPPRWGAGVGGFRDQAGVGDAPDRKRLGPTIRAGWRWLADAACGDETVWREPLAEKGLDYAVGVRLATRVMGRWRIEHAYVELKGELGLGHYEGRNWRSFHQGGAP